MTPERMSTGSSSRSASSAHTSVSPSMPPKARAVLDGRIAADTEDVLALARPVLRHRLLTNFRAEAEKVTSDDVIRDLLQRVRP